jgi:hypothetical protein
MQPESFSASQKLPWTVWVAAAAISLYCTVVLIITTVQLTAIGWDKVKPEQVGGSLGRFLVMNIVAWGLSRRAHWAWWCGILVPGFYVLAGVGAFIVYLTLPADASHPPQRPLLVFPILVLLAAPVAMLLMPSSRSAFRRPTA